MPLSACRLLILALGLWAPGSAQTANAPKWKFDAGVSVSPLFKTYLDEPSCCTPLGGWVTAGSGRFRLQVDYARNERERLGFAEYYEERLGQEIVVERGYQDRSIDQTVGVAAYWRLSGNRRLTPHLLLGMGLWRLADRRCVAEGAPPVVGTPQPGQRFRVDFAGGRPCAGKPFDTSFRIWPQVGAGIDYALGSRAFARVQLRLLELRVGAGIRF